RNESGYIDDQPDNEVDHKHDWFQKPDKPPTPYRAWNKSKSIDFRPPQKWINTITKECYKERQPPRTFNDLMSTPIDFSAYVMNRLKIDNLTQEILVGRAFNLLKGTCKSFAELEYDFKECYKAVNDQLDWHNPEGHDRYDLGVALRMFIRRIVILHRVKDLNITRPETTKSNISKLTPYTTYKNPQGIIYLDKYKRIRLMRSDELYKFYDGTLSSKLDMDYLPKRHWSNLEMKGPASWSRRLITCSLKGG
nr:hypothetical protein [Tanacetum cinerariifolium]GFB05292.1 hypothetical protein [Tanacetum cinerariifolium]